MTEFAIDTTLPYNGASTDNSDFSRLKGGEYMQDTPQDQEEDTFATSHLSLEETPQPAASATTPSLLKGSLTGLAQNPNQTQIAPLSTIGIPSIEVSNNN
jgi:hypothetical protein